MLLKDALNITLLRPPETPTQNIHMEGNVKEKAVPFFFHDETKAVDIVDLPIGEKGVTLISSGEILHERFDLVSYFFNLISVSVN